MWLWLFVAPWCVFALWWAVRALGAAKSVHKESLASTHEPSAVLCRGRRAPGVQSALAVVSSRWRASETLAIAALVVEVCGIAFAIWAREHLGKLWSGRVTLKEGHHLVDTGPYRLVRHPIYTGILVGISAVVMVRGKLSAVLALPLFLIGIARKIEAEEQLLSAELGDEYAVYRAKVRAIIPFIL